MTTLTLFALRLFTFEALWCGVMSAVRLIQTSPPDVSGIS